MAALEAAAAAAAVADMKFLTEWLQVCSAGVLQSAARR
jgi:hypothetical protein